jgi:hypothetical protein
MPTLLLFILITSIACWLFACARPPEEPKAVRAEQPLDSIPTSARAANKVAQPVEISNAAENKPPNLPAPKPGEIKEAVTRVFQQVATLDDAHNPSFVVGDFNGDGSEDLAVAVKPNEGMLIEINSELANWIFEDPQKVSIPGTAPASRPTPANQVRARAEKGDTLLAIIHGYGQKGWRNPEARQTYLLKNGVGVAMKTRKVETLRNGKDRLPPLRGDAIAQTIGGKSGLILWTGAKYAWYSPGLN